MLIVPLKQLKNTVLLTFSLGSFRVHNILNTPAIFPVSEEEKNSLLSEIHAKIEDKEAPGDIDYLPEHAFSFLASRFLKEYESRMGHITAKEIELLFSMERPSAYHPLVVADLNQYHQEQRAELLALNPNRFFMTHANQGNESSAMDVDVQPTQPPSSPQNL
ncbi:hypothetical protein J2N86_08425 [Legionella lytica]|uniref:Uncharacterized protein n=1 Tax=Legionella lytica TaxID=96232 RepID=A0ABY4Y6J4_9GAMM|nr:hypothetical protein [Legionella lytica]USQ12734.1 hypothetical protein J2N86_08425 [Legionella lytica]